MTRSDTLLMGFRYQNWQIAKIIQGYHLKFNTNLPTALKQNDGSLLTVV